MLLARAPLADRNAFMNRLVQVLPSLHASVHREAAFVFGTLFKLSASSPPPLPRNALLLSSLIVEVKKAGLVLC